MTILPGSVVGIIGGGQLGKMLIIAASQMGYKTLVFSDDKNSPANSIADDVLVASYLDQSAWNLFSKSCDVATYEWENVPLSFIEFLEKKIIVRPNSTILKISQNRNREKDFIRSLNINTPLYSKVTDQNSLLVAVRKIGFPCILKEAEMGYDGKGQVEIFSESSLDLVLNNLQPSEKILEKKINFNKEISVVAARDLYGRISCFTPVQNVHKNNILDVTLAPAEVSCEVKEKVVEVTKFIMNKVQYVGTIAVEFFVDHENQIFVNEIAPRPHNSGHWTIDACYTSQFEQHIRAICGLQLGDSSYHSKAIMKNLIGEDVLNWEQFISSEKWKIHVYGKDEIKVNRKMGHLTTLM